MTPGWPVKDGSEETKPTTLTIRVMRSRSPMTLLTAAKGVDGAGGGAGDFGVLGGRPSAPDLAR